MPAVSAASTPSSAPITGINATVEQPSCVDGAADDVTITGKVTGRTWNWPGVLRGLQLCCHHVLGDASCMYNAIAHQAGMINRRERGDRDVSDQLCQPVLTMMRRHPGAQQEDGIPPQQWLDKIALVGQCEDLELR